MPSAEFRRSIGANLVYWLERTQDLDDKTLHGLDREQHNLFRAVNFGLQLKETYCEAANLILQIYPLIERRGYYRRWIPLLENAVGNCAASDQELIVHLLDRLGQCYRLDRRWDKSLARHHQEEDAAVQLGDMNLIAKARLNLSQTYWSQRRYDEAQAYGEKALSGFKKSNGNPEQFAATLSNLGLIALGRGELDAAEDWLEQTIAAYRSLKRPALLARSLMNLTITLERAGHVEKALAKCREAQVVLETTEHELDKVRVELTLGTLYMDLQQWENAENAYKRADSAALRRSGDAYLMAVTTNNLGSVYMEQGRLQESEWALKKAITFGRQSGAKLMLANILGSMAETKLAMDRPDEARPFLDEAIAIAAAYPDDGWGVHILQQYRALRNQFCTQSES